MQEVSRVYPSPFLHTDERKMALRARKTFRGSRETGPWIINIQVQECIHCFI